MQATVINVSAPHYNLGARKLADWLRSEGHVVEYHDGDPGMFLQAELVCISVIFSWHAPLAREIALRARSYAEVWCGGPGMAALATWWTRETGLTVMRGIDQRFEQQRGQYRMTFASRGCPVNCSFCIVPRIEGVAFTFYPDFQPAPILCDNNLSGLPADYQQHIIDRYRAANTPLLDANSGFEPHSFDVETYQRWKPALRGPWRFAFDEQGERAEVEAMMRILKDEPRSKKRVYVLVGNEPIQSCYERAMSVIDWGGEPFCQMFKPLNWLGGSYRTRHDWTMQRGSDFCRYFNRYYWRYQPLCEYSNRKGEEPPFAALLR